MRKQKEEGLGGGGATQQPPMQGKGPLSTKRLCKGGAAAHSARGMLSGCSNFIREGHESSVREMGFLCMSTGQVINPFV